MFQIPQEKRLSLTIYWNWLSIGLSYFQKSDSYYIQSLSFIIATIGFIDCHFINSSNMQLLIETIIDYHWIVIVTTAYYY